MSPAPPVLGRHDTVPSPDQRRAGRSRLLRRTEAGRRRAPHRDDGRNRGREPRAAVTWVAVKEVRSSDWGILAARLRLARQMSRSTSRSPSRPSRLGRSPTRPAKRIVPASRPKFAAAEAVLVPAVLEFLKAGPWPILTRQVTDAFPGSQNASGRVARQPADDGRIFQTGKAASEAARVLAGRGDVSGGGFGDRAPAPEESQGARGKLPT
jgi:hypothetical protein